MPTLAKTAAPFLADLPEPHAHIAWHALSLCSSIDAEERLIHDRNQRAALAALLNEAARQCTNAAMRLNLSPDQADALRAIQIHAPRDTRKN